MTARDDKFDSQAIAVEARDWLDRVSAHGAAGEDEAAMLRWRSLSAQHADALADAMRMRGRMLAARDALRADPSMQPLLTVSDLKTANGPMSAVVGRRAFLGGAIAASVAGVMAVKPPLGLWPSLTELQSDYRTGMGERRTVKVAQGLSIELNTRTSVARRGDSRAHRLALINGEVAVDALHPTRPAVIATSAAEAAASNGRFGVRIKEQGACITCFSGQVAVTGKRLREVKLGRGQQITIGGEGTGAVVAVNPDQADAWRRGELVFADRPLSEVVEEINRYRPGKIILTNARLGDVAVNAVFRLDSLDRAVSQIRFVSNASVTSLPGGVVLLS